MTLKYFEVDEGRSLGVGVPFCWDDKLGSHRVDVSATEDPIEPARTLPSPPTFQAIDKNGVNFSSGSIDQASKEYNWEWIHQASIGDSGMENC